MSILDYIFSKLPDNSSKKITAKDVRDSFQKMDERIDDAKSGIKGNATLANAPTAYTPEAYPDGLFEKWEVTTPITSPNSWGNLTVTQAELDVNWVYFNVTNGVVSKKPSLKPVSDPAKIPLYSVIKSSNISAGTQFIDDENGNIQYRVKTGQTLLTTELPANVVGTKVEKLSLSQRDADALFVTTQTRLEPYILRRISDAGVITSYASGQYQTVNSSDVTVAVPQSGSASYGFYLITGKMIESQSQYKTEYEVVSNISNLALGIGFENAGIYTIFVYSATGVIRRFVRQNATAEINTTLSISLPTYAVGDIINFLYKNGKVYLYKNNIEIYVYDSSFTGNFIMGQHGFGNYKYKYSIQKSVVTDYVKTEIDKISKVYPKGFYEYDHGTETFYIYSNIEGNVYGKFSVKHEINVSLFQDYWRLYDCIAVSYDFSTQTFSSLNKTLLGNGENENVFKRTSASDDFTGGYHGDEKFQQIIFLIDGVRITTPTANIALTQCTGFSYIEHSEMYKTAVLGVTDNAIECYHIKKTDILNGGYKTWNRLTWAVGGLVTIWYHGISCIGKDVSTSVILEDNFTPKVYNSARPQELFIGLREMFSYNQITNFSAKATGRIIKPSSADAVAEFFVSDRQFDSKYYRNLKAGSPLSGDVWESEFQVYFNYN